MNIKIREVMQNDEAKIKEMYEEYLKSEPIPGIDIFEGIRDFENLEKMDFEEWLEDLEKNKDEKNLPETYSTYTLYIAVDEEENIVGAIGLRWKEVPILLKFGGFIGYSIRPKERGKGYATKMLELGLEKFRQTDKDRVLITCKDFNIPSKKVIEKNGGIYEDSYDNKDDGYTYLRYWINIERK